jgi:hypothetical protein
MNATIVNFFWVMLTSALVKEVKKGNFYIENITFYIFKKLIAQVSRHFYYI